MTPSSLSNYADPNSLVSRLRQRRSQLLRELIADVTAVKGNCRVLDVGGEANYWLTIFRTDWLRANRVHVTLLNTPMDMSAHRTQNYSPSSSRTAAHCHTAIMCLI